MKNKAKFIKIINSGRLDKREAGKIVGGQKKCSSGAVNYFVECATWHGVCNPKYIWCIDNNPNHYNLYCQPFDGDILCGDIYHGLNKPKQ